MAAIMPSVARTISNPGDWALVGAGVEGTAVALDGTGVAVAVAVTVGLTVGCTVGDTTGVVCVPVMTCFMVPSGL